MRKTALAMVCFFILSCVNKGERVEGTTVASEKSATMAVFKWATVLCENTGTYDPKKYSEAELKNTYDLWFTYSGVNLETNSNAYFIEDIKKLNSYALMSEYNDKKALYARKTVPAPFWDQLKAEKLQELEDEYELKKITIEAYSNPSVLLNNKYSKYCSEYAEVLASNDTIELLKSWRNLIEKEKSKNGAPENFMEKHNVKYHSKDRLLYAKIELMTYGWWNCSNNKMKRLGDDGTMEKEFNKLFLEIKTECDEP